MAEKDTIFSSKLKHKGVFDFKEFYNFLYEWLDGEEYTVEEVRYVEKINADSKHIEIDWESTKKISDYFKFMIKINWMLLRMKKADVMRDGKKIKMDSGEIEMKFKAILIKDYESKWEDHPFWKFFRGIYDRYIVKSRIDEYEDKVAEEANELIGQAKSFLALEAKK